MRRTILYGTALAAALCAFSSAPGALSSPTSGASGWRVAAPLGGAKPFDLVGAASASDGTYAYVFGGYSDGWRESARSFRYDLASDTWTQLAPMPSLRHWASAVYYPPTNSIYVFGGACCADDDPPYTNVTTALTQVYDITTNSWSEGPSLPDPAGRASMGASYDAGTGKIYLVGGFWYQAHDDGGESDQNWEFDPITGTYTERAPLPNAGDGYTSGMLGSHFYVLSGQRYDFTKDRRFWDYDVTSNTWRQRASIPTSLHVPGSAVADGRLWVFGGQAAQRPSVWHPLRATYSYDPATDAWTREPSLNIARVDFAGVAVGNTLIAAGGWMEMSRSSIPPWPEWWMSAQTETLDVGQQRARLDLPVSESRMRRQTARPS